MSPHHEDEEQIGPVQKQVRKQAKELERMRAMLRKAHEERAAGRAEELHVDIARRVREIERLIND